MTKRKVATIGETVIAAAVEVGRDGDRVAKSVKLLPIGEVRLRDGRGPYIVQDRAHAEQICAATREFLGTSDFMFDYDHQALYAPKAGVGGTAIAAGWARGLRVEDDGIYADVDWTEAAAAKLQAREYRYVSPTFAADAAKRVVNLKNAALVNIPAIDLAAVAAGAITGEDMDLSKIAAAVGLGNDAGEAAIIAAIAGLSNGAGASGLATIAAAVGLQADATAEQIAAAIDQKGKPDPAKYVPIEQVNGINEQLGKLNAERAEREVAAAMSIGKLAPALKKWGLDLFKKDEAAWSDWLAKAPVVVAAGSQLDGKKQPAAATSLTDEEVAAAAMLDMTVEEYLAAKNAEIA